MAFSLIFFVRFAPPHFGHRGELYLRLKADVARTSANEEVVPEGDVAFYRLLARSVAVSQ